MLVGFGATLPDNRQHNEPDEDKEKDKDGNGDQSHVVIAIVGGQIEGGPTGPCSMAKAPRVGVGDNIGFQE